MFTYERQYSFQRQTDIDHHHHFRRPRQLDCGETRPHHHQHLLTATLASYCCTAYPTITARPITRHLLPPLLTRHFHPDLLSYQTFLHTHYLRRSIAGCYCCVCFTSRVPCSIQYHQSLVVRETLPVNFPARNRKRLPLRCLAVCCLLSVWSSVKAASPPDPRNWKGTQQPSTVCHFPSGGRCPTSEHHIYQTITPKGSCDIDYIDPFQEFRQSPSFVSTESHQSIHNLRYTCTKRILQLKPDRIRHGKLACRIRPTPPFSTSTVKLPLNNNASNIFRPLPKLHSKRCYHDKPCAPCALQPPSLDFDPSAPPPRSFLANHQPPPWPTSSPTTSPTSTPAKRPFGSS